MSTIYTEERKSNKVRPTPHTTGHYCADFQHTSEAHNNTLLNFNWHCFFGNKEMKITPKKKKKYLPALTAVKISSIIYCSAIY